jgi:hypothetical protein
VHSTATKQQQQQKRELSTMLGNAYHINYHELRRHETPHVSMDKKGNYFPPKNYAGSDVAGPVVCHPAKQTVCEPGMLLVCADCNVKYEGFDHFKYGCGRWQCRVRLQKGFATLKSMGLITVENHHLTNDSINAMISQGCTLDRIAQQPQNWLPNEPLYDHNPMTGVWESTGVVPLDVWMNLPAEFRMEPMPQDNTLDAIYEAQGDAGRNGAVRRNAPRRLEEKNAMRELEVWYEAQQALRDETVPNYETLLQEYETMKYQLERLESQIRSAKWVVNAMHTNGFVTHVDALLLCASFDPLGHPEYIAPGTGYVNPAAAVPPHPPSIAKTMSDDDVNYMNSL